MEFKKITPEDITDNMFKAISKDWMLITAGNADGLNTMTASWGSVGQLWGKNVATCYIRPTRYTLGFMEENNYYTLSFYSEECLKVFLRDQGQLFDEPVAETPEEAEAFLEDCMAAVVDSIDEVREYFEEEGVDVDGLGPDELEEASEVFRLPDGKYLIVEG